jgi:hypothetical protein
VVVAADAAGAGSAADELVPLLDSPTSADAVVVNRPGSPPEASIRAESVGGDDLVFDASEVRVDASPGEEPCLAAASVVGLSGADERVVEFPSPDASLPETSGADAPDVAAGAVAAPELDVVPDAPRPSPDARSAAPRPPSEDPPAEEPCPASVVDLSPADERAVEFPSPDASFPETSGADAPGVAAGAVAAPELDVVPDAPRLPPDAASAAPRPPSEDPPGLAEFAAGPAAS